MKKILFIWYIDYCLEFSSFEFWSHHHHISTLHNMHWCLNSSYFEGNFSFRETFDILIVDISEDFSIFGGKFPFENQFNITGLVLTTFSTVSSLFRSFYGLFWGFVGSQTAFLSIGLLGRPQFLSYLGIFWGDFHIEGYFYLILPS